MLRSLFYAASVPLLAGFFCLLPRQGGVWTYPGYMSMYIYLLHPLIISNPLVMRAAFDWLTAAYGRKTNVWDPATAPSAVALMPCAALLVTVLLSLPPTRTLFRSAVEPKLSWLFATGGGARVRPEASPPAELRLEHSSWAAPELSAISTELVLGWRARAASGASSDDRDYTPLKRAAS